MKLIFHKTFIARVEVHCYDNLRDCGKHFEYFTLTAKSYQNAVEEVNNWCKKNSNYDSVYSCNSLDVHETKKLK